MPQPQTSSARTRLLTSLAGPREQHPRIWALFQSMLDAWRSAIYLPRHRAMIRAALHNAPVRLHLGCGTYGIDGWLNSDMHPRRDVVRVDVTQRLPFPDASIDRIYSEHLIEHIPYSDARKLCAECFRVLKPGGRIRIATPDLQFLIELHSPAKTPLQARYIEATGARVAPALPPTAAGIINNFFRDWGHRFIYDFQTLEALLRSCGFADIKLVRVGESDDPHFRGIEQHARSIGEEFNLLETMVVEATRP